MLSIASCEEATWTAQDKSDWHSKREPVGRAGCLEDRYRLLSKVAKILRKGQSEKEVASALGKSDRDPAWVIRSFRASTKTRETYFEYDIGSCRSFDTMLFIIVFDEAGKLSHHFIYED
jgi:hypothetical protein